MHVEVLDPTGKPQLSRVTAGTLAVSLPYCPYARFPSK